MNKEKSKILIKNLVIAVAAFAVTIALGRIIDIPVKGYAGSAICQLLAFVIYFIAACLANKKDILKFKTEGFGIGFIISIFILIRTAMALIAFLNRNNGAPIVTVSILEVISLVVFSLLVGLSEETLFRGVVQGSFHDYFGEDNSKHVRQAIIFASVLFGLVHLSNAIGGSNSIESVLAQVVSAIGGGLMFGTIYYRTNKNLWACTIIHAFNDFVSFVASGSLSGGTVSDSINSLTTGAENISASTAVAMGTIVQLLITVISLFICLFFTRKKAVEKQLSKTNR